MFWDIRTNQKTHTLRCDSYLGIYNISGNLVETLVKRDITPGYHQLSWNGQNQSSGVYFVRMVSDGFVETQKLILMK